MLEQPHYIVSIFALILTSSYTETNWSFQTFQIRVGLFNTHPVVGKLCGGATPSNYTSTTNMLYIKFVTDGSNGASGFSL